MTAPKRIWVTVYPDATNGTAWLTEEEAHRRAVGVTAYEYRLVKPKREPLYWVLKYCGFGSDKATHYSGWGTTEAKTLRLAVRYATEDEALEDRDRSDSFMTKESYKPTPVYRKAKP